MAEAETANGVTAPVKLLLNIESPRGLRKAYELAAADKRVAGLQLGYADLFEPAGIHRREMLAVAQTMYQMRMATAEAGVFAYDMSSDGQVREQARGALASLGITY